MDRLLFSLSLFLIISQVLGIPCPAGFSCDGSGNVIGPCPVGYYSPIGVNDCHAAPQAFWPTADQGGVTKCPANKLFSDSSRGIGCSNCPAGIILYINFSKVSVAVICTYTSARREVLPLKVQRRIAVLIAQQIKSAHQSSLQSIVLEHLLVQLNSNFAITFDFIP